MFQPDPRNCKEIKEYHFVRIKRGAYEGDLGLIKKIDTESSNVIVFVVPRLKQRKSKKKVKKQTKIHDIGNDFIDDQIDIGGETQKRVEVKRKQREVKLDRKGRPVPRLFDPTEYDDHDVIQVHPYGARNMHSGQVNEETNFEYR